MNLIIRPAKSTLSTCSGQQMTVEGCTWLTATANNVAISAKFLVARGITEQVLQSCDDGAAAYQLGNTSSRTITEVKQR